MPTVLQRLELVNGAVYQIGETWPGPNPENTSCQVGPIFFRPETTEGVSSSEEEEDDAIVASEAQPAHYEVWRVSDELFVAFFGHLRGVEIDSEAVAKAVTSGELVRRVIYLDKVLQADESWGALEAFQAITERFAEMSPPEEEEEKPTAGSAVQPNSNGASATT